MADDSIEVTADMPFHPTDSPRGMHYYNMDILTDDQQEKLNTYKLNYIRKTDLYLKENPTIRALVAIIYTVILRTRPKRNLHLTIAEYFSKPRNEIEQDVNVYLRNRFQSPKRHEFKYIGGSMGDDIYSSIYSESEIGTISVESKMNIDFETDFIRKMLTRNLNEALAARTSKAELDMYSSKYEEIDENVDDLTEDVAAAAMSQLKGVGIADRTDLDESKFKDKTKKKTTKKTSATKLEVPTVKTEEQWLILMSAKQAEKYKTIQTTMASASTDPEKSRKWYISQMTIAQKQWKLLQDALHNNTSQEVQDALRDWLSALMANTQDMSPEIKEAQMEWLECQMTQGGTMSKSMVDILRLWQSQIILQGSVLTPEMIKAEILKLDTDLKATDTLLIDAREEECERITAEMKQMELAAIMVHEIQELERQWLQNNIDQLSQIGYLTPKTISMQMNLLKLYKLHGLFAEEEYKAKEAVVNDQIFFNKNITYETLTAQKKWIEWQLAEKILTPQVYDIQRQFLDYQLGKIGVTNSQMLLDQMKWLESEMQNNHINKDAYEQQKGILETRIVEQNKDTIPKLQEQLNWLDVQLNHGNISEKKCETEKVEIKEKIAKIVTENKTVEDLHNDLKMLQEEFGQGKITETEFTTKKKNIRERIIKMRQNISQLHLAEMQNLETKLKTGVITQEEYNQTTQVLQREEEAKASDKIELTNKESVNLTDILSAAALPNSDQKAQDDIKIEGDKDLPVKDPSKTTQITDISVAVDVVNPEEEAENRITVKLPSLQIIPPEPVIVDKNQQSSEDIHSDAFNAHRNRRVSIKLSVPDLSEGNKIFRKSLLEVVSLDRRASVRKLMSTEEMLLQPEVVDAPITSPVHSEEDVDE